MKHVLEHTLRGRPRLLRPLLRLASRCDGNVAIELGFVIPLLILLAVGMYDFGRLALLQLSLTSAVRAGVQYGTQDVTSAADTNGMITATRNDAGDPELAVSARQFCTGAGAGAGETACTTTCPSGDFTLMYVDVAAEDQFAFLFKYPGIPSSKAVTSSARMRVR